MSAAVAVDRESLLRLVRCPRCGETFEEQEDSLHCSNGHVYAVEHGIPRLLGPEWDTPDARQLVAETSEAFGDQWTELGERARVSIDDFALHLPTGWDLTSVNGFVLDAGCGMGRYTSIAAELGASAVGLDVSRAVDKAAELWPGVVFIQGDLAHPPFVRRSFDLVYSFGVLHHLPDPLLGFSECFELVKPGGNLLVWVYSEHGGLLRRGRRMTRRVVTRAPFLLEPLAFAAAGVLAAGLALRKRLRRSGAGKLGFYADKGFGQLYTDCHDALAAPAEVYLAPSDCSNWLGAIDASESGFELRRDGSGWLIWARR